MYGHVRVQGGSQGGRERMREGGGEESGKGRHCLTANTSVCALAHRHVHGHVLRRTCASHMRSLTTSLHPSHMFFLSFPPSLSPTCSLSLAPHKVLSLSLSLSLSFSVRQNGGLPGPPTPSLSPTCSISPSPPPSLLLSLLPSLPASLPSSLSHFLPLPLSLPHPALPPLPSSPPPATIRTWV